MKAALLASLIGSVAEKVPILFDTIHKDLVPPIGLGGVAQSTSHLAFWYSTVRGPSLVVNIFFIYSGPIPLGHRLVHTALCSHHLLFRSSICEAVMVQYLCSSHGPVLLCYFYDLNQIPVM